MSVDLSFGHGPRPCPVPPAPELLLQLRARYDELVAAGGLPASTTFEQFYAAMAGRTP